MATPATPTSSDVLHAANPSKLSPEEIAKALARHNREHPAHSGMSAAPKSQKAAPRR